MCKMCNCCILVCGKLYVEMWKSHTHECGNVENYLIWDARCGILNLERGNLMMKVQSIIEDVLIASGVTISLIDIQQILSIVLLVFNVIWILVKCGMRIYEHYKNKNYKAIADDVKDAKDELEILNDSIKDDSEKNK